MTHLPKAILTRESIAEHYLHGDGIEVGALHAPLDLPKGARAQYLDHADAETVQAANPDVDVSVSPDVIATLETLAGIDDASQDFVIANHVLEHCENTNGAVKNMSRVLRVDGIAYLAIPDKRFTFDKDRAVTSIELLQRDHQEGPDWSLRQHYEEWVRTVDRLGEPEAAAKVALMLERRSNIHFHVWRCSRFSSVHWGFRYPWR